MSDVLAAGAGGPTADEGRPCRVSLVAAVARNGVIGRAGALPWRMREDLRRFRRETLGKTVVMGRTTFDSIGRPLPDRRNVVLSRRGGGAPGVDVVSSLAEAKAIAESTRTDLAVIGGAQVYRDALAECDVLLLTWVHAEPDGDTYFPRFDPRAFSFGGATVVPADEHNEYECTFLVLTRRRAAATGVVDAGDWRTTRELVEEASAQALAGSVWSGA